MLCTSECGPVKNSIGNVMKIMSLPELQFVHGTYVQEYSTHLATCTGKLSI
jgi:hypothetical protein